MQKEKQGILLNSQVKDSSSKVIFDEPILCAQFMRDYVDLPYMKDVRPEDIEDVLEQFVPLFAEERNADRVKRVNIKGEVPFFMVSLIEHKTEIEYNVCMQIFRYMVYIWEAYEKEAERKQKGISKLKEFKYPPILPIIYYEGSPKWTAPLDFRSRINQGELFGKYVPDFQCYLVPICNYSNEELLGKADEISLIMLLNKMQTESDVAEFMKIPPEQMKDILKETSEPLLNKITDVMRAFLLKINVSTSDVEVIVGRLKEKKMAELFENVKIDVQAMRKEVEKAEKKLAEVKQELEEAEGKLEETEGKLEETEGKLEETEGKLEKSEKIKQEAIRMLVENCQEFGLAKEYTLIKLLEKMKVSEETARDWLERYWK